MKYKVFAKNIHGQDESLVVYASSEAMALWITVQYAPHLDPFRVIPFEEHMDLNNLISVDFQAKKRVPGPSVA